VNKNGQHEETDSQNGNQYDIELKNDNTNKDNDSVIMDDDIYGDYSAKFEDKNSNTYEISSDDGEKENVNENTTTPSIPENAVHDITTSTSDASTANKNGCFNITK
jgi:hypothetical protein